MHESDIAFITILWLQTKQITKKNFNSIVTKNTIGTTQRGDDMIQIKRINLIRSEGSKSKKKEIKITTYEKMMKYKILGNTK